MVPPPPSRTALLWPWSFPHLHRGWPCQTNLDITAASTGSPCRPPPHTHTLQVVPWQSVFDIPCSHSGHPAQTAIGSQVPSYTLVLETFVPICTVQEVATAAIHSIATLLPCLYLQKTNPTKSMQPWVRYRLFV